MNSIFRRTLDYENLYSPETGSETRLIAYSSNKLLG